MKKLFILLSFLLFIPNINAESMDEFDFQKNDIYDYAEIFGDIEYDRLSEKIKEFELKSSIDLSIITVSSSVELSSMTDKLINMEVKNNKTIYLPSIVIVYEQNGGINLVTNSLYNDVWDNSVLKKFEANKITKYDNIYIFDTELELMLQDWIDYYDDINLINIVLILTLAILASMVILKLLTRSYRPKLITEADKYIKEENIIIK